MDGYGCAPHQGQAPCPSSHNTALTPSLCLLPPRRCWQDLSVSQQWCMCKIMNPALVFLGVLSPTGSLPPLCLPMPWELNATGDPGGAGPADLTGGTPLVCAPRTWVLVSDRDVPMTWHKQVAVLRCPHQDVGSGSQETASRDSQNKAKIIRRKSGAQYCLEIWMLHKQGQIKDH